MQPNRRIALPVTALVLSLALMSGAEQAPGQVLDAYGSPSLAGSSIADRAAAYEASQMPGGRLYAPALIGTISPRPATIQGFGQTIVADSVVANVGIAGSSVLTAQCPVLPGGRVIVQDSVIANGGLVASGGGSATGVAVIDCRGSAPGSTVTVSGNNVESLGTVGN